MGSRLKNSKLAAWLGLLLCIVVLILSMSLPGMKNEWWELIDIFFCFMMVFSHLAALYLNKMSLQASRTLDKLSLIFGILAIVSFIVVYFIN